MTSPEGDSEPDFRQAEENLRTIREVMERSTRHSTFSGLSGIAAGAVSIIGCILTARLDDTTVSTQQSRLDFAMIWGTVVAFAIALDYLLTKRKAALVGKRILSALGKQMALGAGPGLLTGGMLTILMLQHDLRHLIYPMWMLCYGCAVCAVGLFSRKEVKVLGLMFLIGGMLTAALPATAGTVMMILTFGGLHIGYGIAMSRKDGW